MSRKRTKRGYLSFGYKLMLSYAVLIMIPVLLVGYVANSVFVESIRDKTRTNIQGTLQQMRDNIAYRMEDTQRISDMLYYDDSLAAHLRHFEAGWVNYEATKKYLVPKFRTALGATNRRMWMSFYLHNELLPEIYKNYGDADPIALRDQQYDWYHIKRIADKDWYRDFPEEQYGKTMQWKQIEDDYRYSRISLLRRIIELGPRDVKEIGFLRISVPLADLFESVDYQKIGTGATIFIADNRGRVVTSSGSLPPAIGETWQAQPAGRQLAIEQTLPSLGWTLRAVIPANLTERDSRKIQLLTALICAACLLVFSAAGLFISRFFSKRVTKIVTVLDSFQSGEFHKRIHFKGNDEFTRISQALNEMGQNTGRLIREVYLKDLQKKEAELASLQAQINPHFLYNTLSSISRLAKFGEVDKLHRMVLDLAKFYRLSLSDGKNIIPAYRELEQVKAYIDIQKTKYGERMDVLYDIDPSVAGYLMLKLTIQPFVENALEHAWCGDRIHLRIAAKLEDGCIVIQVIDDGVGFLPARIQEIFGGADVDQAGYGIRNVDQRIKLHFGKAYGVTIASRPGIGAAVRIVFPAIRRTDHRELSA
ncbi:sensor histidine kinase [Cohnella sp. REN36]|uniref:sensor histidine kinase n=1 Tax=Cohnella sp. REN36 TaxID=2887347 RepID=UPI001D142977|nr:sensor histidine kinase [Cohnella sp. REN36]MCC3375724.1 sensor histidine kinase [Cohnella sp. REN36]